MESKPEINLPSIVFSKLNLTNRTDQSNPIEWADVRSQVKKALEEFGCFEAIKPDLISHDHYKRTFDSVKVLFDLPLETKKLHVEMEKPLAGYIAKSAVLPLYESFGLEDAASLESVEKFTNTCWPDGNPSISKNIHGFTNQVSQLERIVRKMIVEILGVEEYMEEHLNSTYFMLRCQRYEGLKTRDAAAMGLQPHVDPNTMTILYQNQVGGLQVKTKDGEWITWKPSPHSFLVLVGKALHAWANGRLSVPYHRVMMRGNETRYSLALFAVPKAGYIIKAPKKLVDEEHPLLYKPFDYGEFLKYNHARYLDNFTPERPHIAGQDAIKVDALKAYSGV